jgi:hypothetical protein
MIGNKGMVRAAKKRTLSFYFDLSATTALIERIADPTYKIRIRELSFIYTVASNGGTIVDAIRVGIPGSLTKFFNATPVISQAAGTVAKIAPSSADLIPAGITLLFDKASNTGGTNTGEVLCVLEYELVDAEQQP